MLLKAMVSAVAVGLGVTAVGAGGPDDKPRVDLTLTKVMAERFNDGDVLVICDVVLDNQTGRGLKVRSNFTSPFDGLMIVVRDEKGKLILRQGHTWHQAPFAPPGREFPLQTGENKGELRFPLRLPADMKNIRVMLVGTLPGSGYDELIYTDVVPVTITPAK